VTTVVNARVDLLTRLHNMDFEAVITNLNKLLVNTNEKVAGVDTKSISQRADRVAREDGDFARQPRDEAAFRQGRRAAQRAPRDQCRAQEDAFESRAAEAAGRRGGRDRESAGAILDDPNVNASLTNLSQTLTRINRIVGGGRDRPHDHVRQSPADHGQLARSHEETKRYPANVIFGQPPKPPESIR
jgi:hypothetical protein